MDLLILEDEPIIAIDLEAIVEETIDVNVCHARTVDQAMKRLEGPRAPAISFVLLDLVIGSRGEMSLPVALHLMRENIPFCFLMAAPDRLPEAFQTCLRMPKPFQPDTLKAMLRSAVRSEIGMPANNQLEAIAA